MKTEDEIRIIDEAEGKIIHEALKFYLSSFKNPSNKHLYWIQVVELCKDIGNWIYREK